MTKSNCASSDNKENYESYANSNTLGLNANTPLDEDIFVKILGMNWNTHDDEIIFSLAELYNYASSLPLTKRSVLKVTAKICDPMGFLSPLMGVTKTKTYENEDLRPALRSSFS